MIPFGEEQVTHQTNLLSVFHRLSCCLLINLPLYHGPFQALGQVPITVYLKGILAKSLYLGKGLA